MIPLCEPTAVALAVYVIALVAAGAVGWALRAVLEGDS